jgi:hypothetical protein
MLFLKDKPRTDTHTSVPAPWANTRLSGDRLNQEGVQ